MLFTSFCSPVQEFRSSLRPSSANARLQMHSGSRTSLNTTGVSGVTYSNGTPSATPSAVRKDAKKNGYPDDMMNTTEMNATTTTNRSSMYSDELVWILTPHNVVHCSRQTIMHMHLHFLTKLHWLSVSFELNPCNAGKPNYSRWKY